MAGADPKRATERMLNLLALLTHSLRPLTYEEIMNVMSYQYPDGVEARRTAFERDKKVLRELGVPFTTKTLGGSEAGKTAYAIDKSGYGLVDFGLTPQEISALQEAAALVQTGTSWGKNAVLWLGGSVVPDEDAVTHGLPAVAHIAATHEVLPILWNAISTLSTVTFQYHSKKRTVQPYGLVSRNGFWYLVGFDDVRSTQLVFRVDRIDGNIKTGDPKSFTRPENFDITTAFSRDAKDFAQNTETAIVRIDGGVAPAVLRELGEESVRAYSDDGSIEVEVPCGNAVAFRTWLFAMVDRAEVISPPHVRNQVIGWLHEMLETQNGMSETHNG